MAQSRVRVLYDEDTIARRCEELAAEIKLAEPKDLLRRRRSQGQLHVCSRSDSLRCTRVGLAPQVEFVHLSSYRSGTTSSGQVEILRDVESAVEGRDVLLDRRHSRIRPDHRLRQRI